MIETYINTILLVTGVLTALAGIGFVLPRPFLRIFLGMKTNDATTILVGRHWSLLFMLIGGLLIYAGYHAEARVPVMVAATAEKLALAVLVIASPLRARPLTMAVVGADVVMALLYLLFLSHRLA